MTRGEEPLPDVKRLQTSPVLRHLKPNPIPPAPGPAQPTLSQMYVPEGFGVDLIAAEPEVRQPVAFAFDERGRIWVAEAYSYPQKRTDGEGLDRIVIFEDADGDGRFEHRKVFVEGLNLVSGIEVGFGGVWVGAAPELLFIPDANHDDQPDGPAQVLLNGFGFQDTHECLNSFLWGPDGWLYGNQGVFNFARIGKPGAPDKERTELRAGIWRYHPTKHRFEIFASGGSNQWGLDYDEQGQLFMTHCRSYWGRGLTTHVIQGGHFWNQANANYAPFIIATPPEEFPGFRNFLLASARYDHGAGGAGKPGSDAIFGGHSHVGTLVYQGDNWPAEFHGHLFTLNLHGHQINHQINRRLGSGYETVHAGADQFFCSDPKFVGVDLQTGPDGAVYLIDWYDQQHCHNPNTERWDRGNGRIYRLAYRATYQPRKVDLGKMSDAELIALQEHPNNWHSRTARRLLQERAAAGTISSQTGETVAGRLAAYRDERQRLRAAWTLHVIGRLSDDLVERLFKDQNEFVRAWAIQLALEDGHASASFLKAIVRAAQTDPSALVRLYLASAIQRVPAETAWALSAALAQHNEDRADRNLPWLIWHGLAQRMQNHLTDANIMRRAFEIARQTKIPQLADFIYWYAATEAGPAQDQVIRSLANNQGDTLRRRLAGLELALVNRTEKAMPGAWPQIAPTLYRNADTRVQHQVERLAAVFGDESMFPRLRQTLGDPQAELAARRHAFAVLSRARDEKSIPIFCQLLDDPEFRNATIKLLARFDATQGARALLERFALFSAADRGAALNTLTSRASLARALLEAVRSGQIKRDQVTAFHVRQLTELHHPEVDHELTSVWGRINPSAGEKKSQIARLEKVFEEAPLWAYDAREGRKHFQRLCASCHRLREDGVRLGPELTGAGQNGIRYFLENIIDPDAVVGVDFQMTTVETRQGDVISGLLVGESSNALTLRTTANESVVPKTDIVRRDLSSKSLMPEGLLESLSPREQLELLKYLTAN